MEKQYHAAPPESGISEQASKQNYGTWRSLFESEAPSEFKSFKFPHAGRHIEVWYTD